MLSRIKMLRQEHQMSQQKLGDLIGVSQQSINKYENYDTEPDINALKLIANVFDTSIDYIVENFDIKHKYEKTTSTDLNDEELNHLKKYRKLTHKQRDSIAAIIENYINI